MGTKNISLPDALKTSVDEPVSLRGCGPCSEHDRDTIHQGDRERLRGLLLAGGGSEPTAAVDEGYFESLRSRVNA